MLLKNKYTYIFLLAFVTFNSCKSLNVTVREENKVVPDNFVEAVNANQDTLSSGTKKWKDFFTDQHLIALIDTALKNNQELNIILQEIEIARNEVSAKKGEYLPFLSGFAGVGVDKSARYTRNGALESNLDIEPGKEFPDPLQDYVFGVQANWELDIWKKLRNGKKAAVSRYLSSIEGKNFMVTNLVAEIANEYYKLLGLDTQLKNINQNLEIQSNALVIVKQQKQSAKVTELAVRRFEAQLFNTGSLKFEIEQRIIEVENRLNFLTGSFPKHVERSQELFLNLTPMAVEQGLPSQLLENRLDIKAAELVLEAQKLDVKVAKARFYPSFGLSADLGLKAFNPTYLVKVPESMLFSLAGDMVAPLINRKAIKADYYNANAKQLQAVFDYEKTILSACIEVTNHLSKIENLKKSYEFKSQEVEALNSSISIANTLFKSARADYLEVLLTQEEAIQAQIELIELKQQQMNAVVNTYRALGGGWE